MAGSALNFIDMGEGAHPVVLIHGFTCDLSSWDEQLSVFASQHRCIAMDLPGHGSSTDSAEASIEALAAAANDVLSDLNVETAVLVGHSMGCRVISEMCSQSPTRVAGLVYVDGSITSSSDVEASVSRAKETIERDGMAKFVEALYEGFFVDSTPAAARQRVMSGLQHVRLEFAKRLWPNVVRWDGGRSRKVLASIKAPVLVIQSTKLDPDLNRTSLAPGQSTPWVDAVSQAISDVTLETIQGVGHFPMMEAPRQTNDAILAFIQKLAQDTV